MWTVSGKLTIDELKQNIGVVWEAGVYTVEKGMLERFARAIDDPSPLWQETKYSDADGRTGLEAPPTFVVTLALDAIEKVLASLPATSVLHGGTELKCYRPVREGDSVTVRVSIANIRERQGKMGKTRFFTFDFTYTDERQELLASCRQMIITY